MKAIKQQTKNIIKRKSSRFILMALIGLAVVSYAYLANMTVRTLATLERTKTEIQSLSLEVSDLESERLALENNINVKNALHSGFVEISNPVFIIKDTKATLSLKMD